MFLPVKQTYHNWIVVIAHHILTASAPEAGRRSPPGQKTSLSLLLFEFFSSLLLPLMLYLHDGSRIDWIISILSEYANSSSIQPKNTYPTCNYVNCLCLFIQLFILVFAHAFICHIRGCTRSLLDRQWARGDNPPLHCRAPSWPVHGTHNTPAHDKPTCTSTVESLSVLILEAQILSGYVNKMTLYIINVIANLLLIMKKNQVLTSNIWLEAHQQHWWWMMMEKRQLFFK